MKSRVFEGIANHVSGYAEDYLNVIELLVSPGEDKYLSIGELLPPELRVRGFCAEWGQKCFQEKSHASNCKYRDSDWICRPTRFKFKITVETERID